MSSSRRGYFVQLEQILGDTGLMIFTIRIVCCRFQDWNRLQERQIQVGLRKQLFSSSSAPDLQSYSTSRDFNATYPCSSLNWRTEKSNIFSQVIGSKFVHRRNANPCPSARVLGPAKVHRYLQTGGGRKIIGAPLGLTALSH